MRMPTCMQYSLHEDVRMPACMCEYALTHVQKLENTMHACLRACACMCSPPLEWEMYFLVSVPAYALYFFTKVHACLRAYMYVL